MQPSESIATDVSVHEMKSIADDLLSGIDDGEPLDPLSAALIELGVAVAVTSLDRDRIGIAIDRALDSGASVAQAQEIISLISGLGVHSLMIGAPLLAERARASLPEVPLTREQQALWDRHVGDDPFWIGFEREVPGFLDGMLRLSSDQFTAFFDYCAVPWRSGTVRARCKELVALASDATPTHRFLPGFRLHLRNAIALGAGRLAVKETLAIAAAAPPHQGTR